MNFLLGAVNNIFNFLLETKLFDVSKLDDEYAGLAPIVEFLDEIIIPLSIVLGVAAALLSIFLGVMLAKAESSDKVNSAKKRLVGLIITLVIVVGLVWLLSYVFTVLPDIMSIFKDTYGEMLS